MNRRSFISDMLKVGVACTFLPGAGRIWKPIYGMDCGDLGYSCVMIPQPATILCSETVTIELDFQEFVNLCEILKQRGRDSYSLHDLSALQQELLTA